MEASTRASQRILVLAICAQLTGCSLYRAATFSSAPASYARDQEHVQIQTFATSDSKDCDITDSAIGSQSAVAGIAIAAVATVVMNIAESEIDSYISKKQKEFTAQYSASVNSSGYYIPDKPGDISATFSQPSLTCIRIRRDVVDPVTKQRAEALQWVGQVEKNQVGTALRIRTVALRLSRSAARTDKLSRKVDISVEFKIDATYMNDSGAVVTTTVADKTLSYPGTVLPEASPYQGVAIKDTGVSSSWFAAVPKSNKESDLCNQARGNAAKNKEQLSDACGGITSLSISIGVTETGSGADTFGSLGKQVDDNKATLNKMVSDVVGKYFPTTSATGTSKPATPAQK